MERIAIIHFTNYPKGQSRSCMAAVMRYTMQEKKTVWEGKKLITGINCRPESVYTDFLNTKLLYHKDSGVMFFHMVQSFPKGENVDPVTAHAAALRLAEYFEGREVLVCTHTDRDHVHSHFIINSVNLEDGKKLHISEPELTELRQRNDQICIEFGLPVFQSQNEKRVKSISNAEYHTAAKGGSWKFRLVNTIDECMRYAKSRDEFIALMRSEGYDVRWTDSRKNIIYTTPDGLRCRDDRLHYEKYLKEAMEREFRIREAIVIGRIETVESSGGTAADSTSAGAASLGRGMGWAAGCGKSAGTVYRNTDGYSAVAVQPDGHIPNPDSDRSTGAGDDTDSEDDTTGWEEERAALFSAAHSYTQYSIQSQAAVDPGSFAGVIGSMVQFGRAVERAEYTPVVRDSTTMRIRTDSKALKKERQKKIAQGHARDDHEDEQTWRQTM